MDMRVGPYRGLSMEELMLLNCDAEDSWESLGQKGDQANLKGNQPKIIIERTDVEAEAQILWPSDENSQLIGKDHDARKDWGQEKIVTGDEMVGWHYRLNGHEFG